MIDFEELRQEIRNMNCRKKLFKVLKKELSALGHWKNKPRGKPNSTYFAGGKQDDKAELF